MRARGAAGSLETPSLLSAAPSSPKPFMLILSLTFTHAALASHLWKAKLPVPHLHSLYWDGPPNCP